MVPRVLRWASSSVTTLHRSVSSLLLLVRTSDSIHSRFFRNLIGDSRDRCLQAAAYDKRLRIAHLEVCSVNRWSAF